MGVMLPAGGCGMESRGAVGGDFLDGLLAHGDFAVVLEATRGPDGSIADLVFRGVNSSVASFLGRSRQDLIGRSALPVLDSARTSEMFTLLVEVLETGRPMSIDNVSLGSDLMPADPVYDACITPVRDSLLVTLRESTERTNAVQHLEDSEARFRLVAEHATDVVLFGKPDSTVLWVSDSVHHVLGLDPHEIVGTRGFDLIHPDDLVRLQGQLERVSAGHVETMEARALTSSGDHRWISARVTPIGDQLGDTGWWVAGWRDIEDERRSREELARSEELFRASMRAAPIGMALVDMDRRFTSVNPALCNMVGHDEAWLLTHRVPDILDPLDNEADLRLRARITQEHHPSATAEKRLLRSDGTRVWAQHVVAAVHDGDGDLVGYISQFLDITDNVRTRDRLRFEATHDALTHVGNRKDLYRCFEDLTASGAGGIGVLFIDLDHLKEINDTYGHPGGDDALVEVARRIQRSTRRDDVVTRFGGDEFVVVLPRIESLEDLKVVAANIMDSMSEPALVAGHEVDLAVSIGVARVEDVEDLEAALARADAALYQAKTKGRNRIELHHSE